MKQCQPSDNKVDSRLDLSQVKLKQLGNLVIMFYINGENLDKESTREQYGLFPVLWVHFSPLETLYTKVSSSPLYV